MTRVPRSLAIGAISLITLGCGQKHVEPTPARINSTDPVAVAADTTAPLFEYQVESPAFLIAPGETPHPSKLVDGSVTVRFVVDTSGHADMSTFKVLQSTNDSLSAAVRRVIPTYAFYPAEVAGRKVKQYVQMPFKFVKPKH
jgi:TonB family protein